MRSLSNPPPLPPPKVEKVIVTRVEERVVPWSFHRWWAGIRAKRERAKLGRDLATGKATRGRQVK